MTVLLLSLVAVLLVWLELLSSANVALRERCGILALLLKDAQRAARDAQQVARFRTLEEMTIDALIDSTREAP